MGPQNATEKNSHAIRYWNDRESWSTRGYEEDDDEDDEPNTDDDKLSIQALEGMQVLADLIESGGSLAKKP